MRLKSSKALSLVSLATKAGKTASGEFCTEKEVKTGMAELVIVAEDASANTKKKCFICVISMKCQFIFMGIKIPWGMQWEKNSGRHLQ